MAYYLQIGHPNSVCTIEYQIQEMFPKENLNNVSHCKTKIKTFSSENSLLEGQEKEIRRGMVEIFHFRASGNS